MYRMLEIMTRVAPEIWVDKTQIHSIRLLNHIMFILHSIFQGGLDTYVDNFANKIKMRSDNLA